MSETECIVRPGCQCQAKHQQDAGGRPIDRSQPLAPPMPVSRTMAKQAIDLLRQMDNIPVGQPSPMRETIHLLERQLDEQPPPALTTDTRTDTDIAIIAAAERIAITSQPGYPTTTNRDNIRRVAEDELRRISDTAYRQGVNHAAPISPPSPPPPALGNPASTAVCGLPDCDYQATGRTQAEAQAALTRHWTTATGRVPAPRTNSPMTPTGSRSSPRTVAQLATLIETEMPAGTSREQALWLTLQAQRCTELAVSMTWRTGTTIRHHMANAATDTNPAASRTHQRHQRNPSPSPCDTRPPAAAEPHTTAGRHKSRPDNYRRQLPNPSNPLQQNPVPRPRTNTGHANRYAPSGHHNSPCQLRRTRPTPLPATPKCLSLAGG